jgi:hypothetical protein
MWTVRKHHRERSVNPVTKKTPPVEDEDAEAEDAMAAAFAKAKAEAEAKATTEVVHAPGVGIPNPDHQPSDPPEWAFTYPQEG